MACLRFKKLILVFEYMHVLNTCKKKRADTQFLRTLKLIY